MGDVRQYDTDGNHSFPKSASSDVFKIPKRNEMLSFDASRIQRSKHSKQQIMHCHSRPQGAVKEPGGTVAAQFKERAKKTSLTEATVQFISHRH